MRTLIPSENMGSKIDTPGFNGCLAPALPA